LIPLDVELVRAGPGTGKTYQLAQRFASLVLDVGHDPARIAAVTFTRAAAAELRERVREALEERGATPGVQAKVDDAPMLTIDAFSNWILRMSTTHRFVSTTPVSALLGSGSRRRRAQRWLLDDGQATTAAVTRVLAAGLPAADPGFGNPHLQQLVDTIVDYPARVRAKGPGAALDWISIVTDGSPKWPELQDGDLERVVESLSRFGEHEALDRLGSGATSYEDTTALAVEFVQSADGAVAVTANLSAVLVDELQDTDPLQERLLQSIWAVVDDAGAPAVHRFMVGDLKQAIYQFRNADPRVMERFIASTPIERHHALTTNRRSTAAIVTVLNQAGHDWFPSEPELSPLDEERSGACILLGASGIPKDEGRSPAIGAVREFAAQEIASVLASQRSLWEQGTCALLVPTRTGLEVLERELRSSGLPVLNLASAPHESAEVQEARVLLRAVADPADGVALVGAMRGPAFAIADSELDKVITSSAESHLAQLSNGLVTRNAMNVLAELRDLSLTMPVGPLVEHTFEVTGLWDLADEAPTWSNRLHWVVTQAHEYDRRSGGSLGRFLIHLEALATADRSLTEQIVAPIGEPVIQIMTMHNAKGLEFDTVIVAGLVKGGSTWRAPFARWSHDEDHDTWRLRINAGQEDAQELVGQIEQQKRLLYVAMSRARTNLIIGLHHGVGASAPPDDPCTLLREALDGLSLDTDLVEVLAPSDAAALSDRLPAPVQRAVQPVACTVTSLSDAPAGNGGGRGRLHGEQVHLAVAAALEHYGAGLTSGVDELVASLEDLALDAAVAAEAASVLRLPTIAEGVAAGERIESEYPVAGLIDGEPIYGVADIVIFKTDGSVVVGDIKTDHVGETDPAGTNYEQQLAAYGQLIASGLAADVRLLLLGPTPSVKEAS